MAQNTNLNVTPYYDDFDKDKNFYRVLFRPGFPIQARELTSMQSIMQNQVENVGSHLFKDGAMVIPGQVGYDLETDAIMLQESFLGADVELYREQLHGKIITGLTSGVKAKVLFSISETSSEKGYITLYLKYIESGGDNQNQTTFTNNEQLITDTEITFGTTLIEVGSPFAQLLPTAAIQTGSVAYVQEGVYFIRGFFVDVAYQYILLDQYGTNPKYRIGLEILESIVTPEDDLTLNDNAAGTSNYAAPGAHRFRITTNLVKKLLDDTADKDFIELLRINGDKIEKLVERSAYDELEKSLALRTYEESGDYVVNDFQITNRENLNDGFNNGVYESGDTTASGNTADAAKYAVEFGPGTAYVRGYRIKTMSPTYVDLDKPRDTNNAQNTIIPFELGNFSEVENVYGFLNVSGSTITSAYQTVELRDQFTSSPGSATGEIVGYARVTAIEHKSDGADTTFGNADDRYKLYLFDIQMFTAMRLASNQTISAGSVLIGKTSGARAYLVNAISSADDLYVYQVEGQFKKGEIITVDGLDKDTIVELYSYEYADTRQVVARDESNSAIEFTADIVLEDQKSLQGATFTYSTTKGEVLTTDTVGAADASRSAGTYTITASDYTTDGSGTGATFSIVVAGNGAATVTITNGGNNYVVDETFTITDAKLGGGGGASLTFDVATVGASITGLNSNFSVDLRAGDRIFFNSTKFVDVTRIDPTDLPSSTEIFNFGQQTVNVTPGGGSFAPTADDYTAPIRYRAKLKDTDKASLLQPLPRPYVKSISDESMVVRRTFDSQTVSTNSISITLPENEQFEALSDQNYTITVLAGSNSDHPVGDQIPIVTEGTGALGYTSFTSADRTTIQVDNLTNITSVKVTASVSKNVTQRKTKSPQKMFVLKANKTVQNLDKQQYGLAYSDLYGTRIEDRDISLGIADVYKIHAVYESLDDNDPVLPSITLVEPTFFATGSIITGKTSKARARVVDFNSSTLKLTVVYLDGLFSVGETVNGFDSNSVAITGIINDSAGSIIAGSKVITDRYDLVTGQTDFIYGISKLTRKSGVATPTRKLKFVIDYYSHAATGDYFGGQSYLDTAYEDIPTYNAIFLPDFLDFRPGVRNLYTGTGTVASPAYVQAATFDFNSRTFPTSATPAPTLFDIPKVGSSFRCDFDWYLGRIDKVFVLPTGEFQIIKGKSAEEPDEPDDLQEGMLLATLIHAPYGFQPDEDIIIIKSENKRYSMRDIGKLETRIDQVEYYTSLNMLEQDTFNTEITDASGKSRLKNGFIVDDFTDHSKSATDNFDYNASLDYEEGACHPSHYTTNMALVINETLSTNYQKTGPLITLPYSEEKLIEQPYASRVENVNPFNVFAYIGRIDLVPASDDWIDTQRLPVRVTNIEGNFEATRRRLRVNNNGFAPVQWRSWRTTWRGTSRSSRTWNSGRRSAWGRGRATLRRTRIRTTRRQVRSGIRTRVVPRIDRRSLGDSLVSATSIPWIRSRNIDVTVVRMKPRTKFFGFFDGQKIGDYMIPKVIEVIKDPSTDSRTNSTPFVIGETVIGQTSGARFKIAAPNDFYKYNPYDDTDMPTSYSSTTNFININTTDLAAQAVGSFYGNIQVGELLRASSGATAVVKDRRLLTDRLGQWKGSFFIPSPATDTNPRWATGTRTLRLTTNEDDSRLAGAVASAAETEYEAAGTLNRVRENVLAVRNAELVRDTVRQRRTVRSTRTETRQVGWWDPLAQSFLVTEEGGTFLTSVEIYFNTKDSKIPISMQIRTMENGYPTTAILPFSDTTLNPEDVQISEGGTIATKFTFRAPVYIPQSVEHCFVLFSDSNEYKVWISRMGELDISGDRTISEQPYAGVLFKSQNATTWTADQYEDMKFIVNRAKFDISGASRVSLNNAPLEKGNGGQITLENDAITTFQPELQLVLNSTSLPYTIGARLTQETTLAQGTIKNVQNLSAGVTLTISDISGTWAAGSNTGGVITNRIISSKTTATLVVASASGDFTVGETITGGTSNATAEVVTWTSGTNTLTLKSVSNDFTAGSPGETITGSLSGVTATVSTESVAGDAVESGAVSDAFVNTAPTYTSSQRRVRVDHTNHGMHDLNNNVVITGVASEVSDTYLTSSISASDTTINVNDATAFHRIINGTSISSTNVGYIMIGEEIMSYSAISSNGKTITAHERGLDGTTAVAHADESVVKCYNLDGIPLTEINKTHSAIQNPSLDTYDLTTSSIGRLGIRSGGENISATQNIQYEILVPQIEKMLLPKTDMTARVQTITGTSINDGITLAQSSFSNTGEFVDVNLSDDNYFPAPQIICSNINESTELSGDKSLRMDLTLSSTSETVSPVMDTDRMSITMVSSRINSPSDENTATLSLGDEHAATYITKIADLVNPSSSIKLIFAGYRPPNTFIKPLYRVLPTGSTDSIEDQGFTFFPTNDATVPDTTESEEYEDYEYEVSGLSFSQYQIKIVFVSKNQAYTPIIKDLRAIALAV